MDKRIEQIRESERKSHIDTYTSTVLFEKGSWLSKPIKTVMDLLPFFEGKKTFRGLDLGSGVGRNCIPLAQHFNKIECEFDCVDILELAVTQLKQYSQDYHVDKCINGFVMPLEDFKIKKEYYDLILGISSLEHVKSEESLLQLLLDIREGLNVGGIACFVINSEVLETDIITGESLLPQFEVNLSTQTLIELLKKVYEGWEVIKCTVKAQEYDIPRENIVHLTSNVVTWVARKKA